MSQIAPEFLHLKQHILISHADPLVIFIDLVMEPSNPVPIRRLFACQFPCQPGIHKDSSSHHVGLYPRESLLYPVPIRHRKYVSVIAERIPAFSHRFRKYFQIRRILIKVLLQAGMDDQFFYRVLVVDFQQPSKLIRAMLPDSGLDGYPDLSPTVDFIQKPVQFIGHGKESGSPVFGYYRLGRTAQV